MAYDFTQINWSQTAVYVARYEFYNELNQELSGVKSTFNDLMIAQAGKYPIFAQDIWHSPEIITIDSIGDAVKKLKAIQPFWYAHPITYARRCLLIEQQLPQYNKLKPHQFPLQTIPNHGVFTLLDQNTLLYSIQRDKPVPDGYFEFDEDKTNPPNRAYLKLWEALCLLGHYPQPGEFALDLGASPGGWSYVLQSLGTQVLAIDKAPLDPSISKLNLVDFQQGSAFALDPKDFTHIDWLVGDSACYPERLYGWLQPWLASNKVKQVILTLKLQGETNLTILQQFQAIPNSRVLQLTHNKHEVTFIHPWFR